MTNDLQPQLEAAQDPPWSREFLDRFRSGQQAALREVYHEHVADLSRMLRFGFVFQSGGQTSRFRGFSSPYELQDALQESFRRAFEPRARESFDGLRPYRPYLRTIARNVVIASFRRHRAMFELLPEEDSAAVEHVGVTAEQEVQAQQVQKLVRGFLGQLSENDRKLLQLRFCEGVSQRDVASQLAMGRQVLRTREAALRKQLEAYLREQGEEAWIASATGAMIALLPFLSSVYWEAM